MVGDVSTSAATETNSPTFPKSSAFSAGSLAIGILCSVALASAARLVGLGTEALWMDEAATLHAIRGSIWDLIGQYDEYENTPPLYYLLLRAWVAAFGDAQDGLLRLPSALSGIVATGLVAWTAGMLAGARRAGVSAWVAGGIFALSTTQVAYAQEARAYALLVALAAGSTCALVAAKHSTRHWLWLVYGISALAMIYTHFGGIAVVMAHGISLLANRNAQPIATRRYAIVTLLIVCAASAPLMPSLVKTRGRMQAGEARTIPAAVHHTASTFVQLAGGELIFLAMLPAAGLAMIRRPDQGGARTLLAGLIALPLIIPLAAWWTGGAQYFPRHALAGGIGLSIAAGLGIASLHGKWRAGAAVAIVLLAGGAHVMQRDQLLKPAMRDAAAFVASNASPGDTVVVSLLMSGWSFDRYHTRTDLRRRDYDEFSVKQITAGSGEPIERLWLVFCPPPADERGIFHQNPLIERQRVEFRGVRVVILASQPSGPGSGAQR